MSFQKTIGNEKSGHALKALLISFLLIVYLAGAFQVESLHRIFHSHQSAVEHSDEEENDSCHRSIYHNDFENGCGHGSHVVAADKCVLCDVIASSHQEFLTVIFELEAKLSSASAVLYSFNAFTHSINHLPARAPPAA